MKNNIENTSKVYVNIKGTTMQFIEQQIYDRFNANNKH